MWIGVGFGVAVIVGVGVALLISTRGNAHENPMPWSITDLARLQASIMAMLGGVSITGIVIVIGFLSRQGSTPPEMDTLTLMFAVAFGYFLQTAFTLSYLPDRAAVGEPLFRFYYALASTLQFRTILLLALALTEFTRFFQIGLTAQVLTYIVPFSMVSVLLVIAVVSDALGLLSLGECYLTAAAGLAIGALFVVAMRWLQADPAQAQIVMTIAFVCVNGLTYIMTGLVPLAARRPRLQAFLTRHARSVAAIDMQTTIISLTFLWLAVARVI